MSHAKSVSRSESTSRLLRLVDRSASVPAHQPRTVFDHIPKTAGTSVRAAMARAFGESGDLPETPCPHHIAIREGQRRRYIAGHLWFYPGEALAPGWLYATVLRDPIDRFLSQYFFYRQHRAQVLAGTIRFPEVVAAVHLELAEYLEQPHVADLARNYQARHFAWRMHEAPERLTEHQLFDLAVASLQEYDVVGVFADLQGFVDVYCDGVGAARQQLPHVNATLDRPAVEELPPALIEALRSRNAVDLAVCAWARDQVLRRQIGGINVAPRRRQPSGERDGTPPEFGDRQIVIVSMRCEPDGVAAPPTTGVRVTIRGYASITEPALTIGIAVRDSHGHLVFATNTHWLGVPITVAAHAPFGWQFLVPVLPAGTYSVTLALHKGVSHLEGCYHWVEDATSFVVPPR